MAVVDDEKGIAPTRKRLSLEGFSVQEILQKGDPLLASAGQEYEIIDFTGDAKVTSII